MAQECGFFNAELQGSEYDRVYNAEQFAAYFASFIGNGVFGNSMGELVVLERTENNMSVDVSSGQAWINGWWYRNTETYNLPIAIADGVLNRKDIVVLRWGNTERDMWLQVIQGEPSEEPIAPSIVRNADYYDLELCEISIPAGTSSITQALITDMRPINSVCGFVTGLIDQIDTTELYLQFRAQFSDFMDMSEDDFNVWFNSVKDQITTDLGIRLQLEIGDLTELVTEDKSDLVSAINEAATTGGTPGVFYDTYEEAETDLANIDEGSMVYTNEPDSTIQDIIDGMTSLHLVGTQRGSGSTNVTVITESSKRLLAITKKSGVIVETKEIPTSVLESGDVVLLGNIAPVVYQNTNTLDGQKFSGYNRNIVVGSQNFNASLFTYGEESTLTIALNDPFNVASDSSQSTGASITYNGSNSFTITVTDSTLSVYLYTDMLVLGGSASGRNVSFDASGTDLSSTDVEGAIKEVKEINDASFKVPDYANGSTHVSGNAVAEDGFVTLHTNGGNTNHELYINSVKVGFTYLGSSNGFQVTIGPYPVKKGDIISATGSSVTITFYPIR